MRASKLIEYLYTIIDEIIHNNTYEIKADFLDDDINSYSIDKIPTASTESKFITGERIKKDEYSLRSRFKYTSDQAEELKNIGFFEKFESKIERNNRDKILPDIEGVQKIECLNSGSVVYADDNKCEMRIQIKVTYLDEGKPQSVSL